MLHDSDKLQMVDGWKLHDVTFVVLPFSLSAGLVWLTSFSGSQLSPEFIFFLVPLTKTQKNSLSFWIKFGQMTLKWSYFTFITLFSSDVADSSDLYFVIKYMY